jgi:hypothetical protein
MKILRDESGHVLLGLVTDAQPATKPTEPQRPVQPTVEPDQPSAGVPAVDTALRPTPHSCFHCSWCDAILTLPHDRLGLAFAAPVLRRIDARSIGTVCSSCQHVAGYSLFRGAYGYDTRHKLAPVQPAGVTVLVDMLRCDEETCTYPLPFFLTSDGPLTGAAVKDLGLSWDWDNLTCASGHRIRRPIWLYDRKPLVFPPQLK